MFSEKKPLVKKEIISLNGKSGNIIRKAALTHFTCQSTYFSSIWFNVEEKFMKIRFFKQNNQYLRLTFIKDKLITNFETMDETMRFKPGGSKNNLISSGLFWYQPFYPSYFYETFKIQYDILISSSRYLFIGNEHKLGVVEAAALINNKLDCTESFQGIDVWLVERTKYVYGEYVVDKLPIDCLNQVYDINFLTNGDQLKKYDLIYIDLISKYDNVYEWKKAEKDLHYNIGYLIKAMRILDKKGKLIIKMSVINPENWMILFKILNDNFETITSSPSHCATSPEIFYTFSDKNKKVDLYDIYYTFLESLDRIEIYKIYYLNYYEPSNYYQIHLTERESWFGKLKSKDRELIFCRNLSNELNHCSYIPRIGHQWYNNNKLEKLDLPIVLGRNNNYDTFDYIDPNNGLRQNINIVDENGNIIGENGLEQQNLFFMFALLKCRILYVKKSILSHPNHFYSDNLEHCDTFITIENNVNNIKNKSFIKVIESIVSTKINVEWIFFYEFFNAWKIKDLDNINSLHLYERGEIVSSLNHYLNIKSINHTWHVHLNEEIDDFEIIKINPDNTFKKNITKSSKIKRLAKKMKDINFITANAKLPYNHKSLINEEKLLSKIIMAELITILACLSKGGMAIIRFSLPLCEPLTISLISIIKCYFNDVNFFNMQNDLTNVYLELFDFIGIDKQILYKLYTYLDDPEVTHETFIIKNMTVNDMNNHYNMCQRLVDSGIIKLTNIIEKYNTKIHVDPNDLGNLGNWIRFNPIRNKS